jgi:cellulose synthase/poly-beta-1,6-N-acetylglucosamine synthase-like glycosyltransferase
MGQSSDHRALDGRSHGQFANLRRRIYLTYKYRGIGSLLFRAITFPLRFTPLKSLLNLDGRSREATSKAISWYRRNGRPVTIVIPSYRDAELVEQLVAKIRKTTKRSLVRIIVTDDASGPEHVAALQRIRGIEVLDAAANSGFAANVNRGLKAAGTDNDVVLLNSDTVPRKGWLACLQYATSRAPNVGLVAAKLLYPDNRIQYGGTVRNLGAPEWFDHRYRFKPANWGPAQTGGPTLAATGA